MKVDVLVAEIGSTTTLVNAFNIHSETPKFIGRGVANTTVQTNVLEGLQQAVEDLSNGLGVDSIEYDEMFASSSAAGGLKMTVHGLVYEMTVRASKEAALNAGANIHLVTANKVTERELDKVRKVGPNIILVAGGTNYGETDTALYNMEKLLGLDLDVPMIYAGNIENHEEIRELFEDAGKSHLLKIVENVYPRVDLMNILPLRKAIYETFEEHIIHAKGMNHIKEMVNQSIMPTPGSVMESTLILREEIGNIMTIDVGGATTDVHSVANPSDDYAEYLEGEPLLKRSVEGDLGVFINHENVLDLFKDDELLRKLSIDKEQLAKLLEEYTYIPLTQEQRSLVFELAGKCLNIGLNRHIGDLKRVFTTMGQKIIPEGKDCTQVEHIILTGGALINLEGTEDLVKEYISKNPTKLVPNNNVNIYKDHDYIMASVGVLSLKYPEIAVKLLKQSLRIEG